MVEEAHITEERKDQIPEGYQLTEVGVIPEDWKVVDLGKMIDFQGGSQPPIEYFRYREQEGYIRLIQIRDYKSDKNKTYIPKRLARKFCDKEDIMIGRYGPPIFQILRGLAGAYNVALIKANPTGVAIKEYCYHVLKQDSIYHFVEKLSQRSGGQTGIDLNELRTYKIPLPPTPAEQQAIGKALSDMDALIEGLERLVEKKRLIKQGAMWKLLQPKNGWEKKKLGEVCSFFSGGTPSTSNQSYYGGSIPWITSSDLNQTIINSVAGRITKKGLDNSSAKMVEKNTLLVALYGATAGVTAISKIRAAINQAVLAILPREEVVNSRFLFYQLSALKNWIITTYIQGGQGNLSGKIFKDLVVSFPSLHLQMEIAEILSNMDIELSHLEFQLFKYHQLKKGMMQELLTGKKRLI